MISKKKKERKCLFKINNVHKIKKMKCRQFSSQFKESSIHAKWLFPHRFKRNFWKNYLKKSFEIAFYLYSILCNFPLMLPNIIILTGEITINVSGLQLQLFLEVEVYLCVCLWNQLDLISVDTDIWHISVILILVTYINRNQIKQYNI